MPGIAGIVELDGRLDLEARLGSMLSLMQHESWYKLSRLHQKSIALGKALAGIIDSSPQLSSIPTSPYVW